MKFLNSQFFSSLVTIFVGLFAFIIYWLQKRKTRREAAIIILNEIKNIEKCISEIESNLSFVPKVIFNLENLRTIDIYYDYEKNSWFQYRHLFVGVLNTAQYESMDSFYKSSILLHKEMDRLKSIPPKQTEEKTNAMQNYIVQMNFKDVDSEKNIEELVKDPVKHEKFLKDLKLKKDFFINLCNSDNNLFGPDDVIQQIGKYIELKEPLDVSARNKLMKIGKIK